MSPCSIVCMQTSSRVRPNSATAGVPSLYVERLQPIMDDIARRYPATAPADFDPYYAGETRDEDAW